MKEFTIDEIQHAMENLPPAVQEAFISIDLELHLENIAKMYGLKEEIGTSLFNDTAYVMIGLADKSYYEEHLREALKNLPESTISAISERITDEIFIPFEKNIQSYLAKKGIYENDEEDEDVAIEETNETAQSTQMQMSEESMIENQQLSVLKAQGINIINGSENYDYEGFPRPAPAPQINRLQAHMPALTQNSSPSRDSIIEEIEHPHSSPSLTNPQTSGNSLVQSKFESTVHIPPTISDHSIGVQKESLIHSQSKAPASYTVDPYHEPIE